MATSANEDESLGEIDKNEMIFVIKQMLIQTIYLDSIDQFFMAIDALEKLNLHLNWRAKFKNPSPKYGQDFFSPLGYATASGRPLMVEMLLAKGADPNFCSNDKNGETTGRTALHEAVRFGQLKILDILLKSGACDVNKIDLKGWTALNTAVALDKIDFAMKLIDFGANPKGQLIIQRNDVTPEGRYSLTSVFQLYGWYMAAPSQLKWNTLHLAAHCHHPEIITRLVDEFFSDDDVNIRSSMGATPLHEAVLLPKNYDVLDRVRVKRRYETIKILLERGANPDIRDNKGRTALHIFLDHINLKKCIIKSNPEIVCKTLKLILEQKANPCLVDDMGKSLLHQIAVLNNEDALKLLLDFGANGALKDSDGNIPAHVAAYHGRFDALSLLFHSRNFSADELNKIGETILHAVIKSSRNEAHTAKMVGLLKRYVNVNCVNIYGETAHDLARVFHLNEVATLLNTCCNDEKEEIKDVAYVDRRVSQENRHENSLAVETNRILGEEKNLGDRIERKAGPGGAAVDGGAASYAAGVATAEKLKLQIDERTNVADYLIKLCDKYQMGKIHMDAEGWCHERCEIAKQTKTFVEELFTLVETEDARFSCNVLCTGSAFEGYRISKPDEFDYMCEVRSLSGGVCQVLDSDVPGFVRICIKEENRKDWEMFTSEDGLLDSNKIKAYIGETLHKKSRLIDVSQKYNLFFNTTSYDGCKFCQPLIKLSKAGIKMAITWQGKDYPMMLIDVDITPAIHFQGWPESAKLPPSHVLDDCQNLGYHVIPKTEGNDPLLWRLSFSKAELGILQNVNEIQGMCYTSLKMIKDATVGLLQQGFSHLGNVHTYILKTKFFEELENEPGDSRWSKDELVSRICSILESTTRYISQTKSSIVESYFLPGYNVIGLKKGEHYARFGPALIKETLTRIIKILRKEEFIKQTTNLEETGFKMKFKFGDDDKVEYDGCVILE